MVIVLTSLLKYFVISDDFRAVKSSHVLEAHPPPKKKTFKHVSNSSCELFHGICLFPLYQCQGIKQMAPLLQILQMKSLDVLFHYEKLNNIILNHWLEGLRILNMEYVNSQEWRAKCQHQKSYQKTNKCSWIISLQSWKKDTVTFPCFQIFWAVVMLLSIKTPKILYKSLHWTLVFFCTLIIYDFWSWNGFLFALDETLNKSSIISLPNGKPIKGNLRNIDGAKRKNTPP